MDSPHIPFSHLHTHSPEGSLLDGFMRIEKAIALAKEWGMDALGISDHGTMAAHEKFYNACKKEGLHPVLGMEAYITVDKRFRKADFESVDFILDENERYIFSFLSEKEQKDSETDWIPVDSLKPNKLMVEVMGLCRETFLNDLLQASFLPGQEFPKAKAAVTRMQNAYKLEQEQAGRQLCIQADATRREFFSWFPRMGHLLLIAKNNEGYQNLLQLNSIGQLQGFYAKPRVDFEDIKKFGKGIVCSTACLGSITSQLILRGRLEEAKQEIQRLVEAFDEVYLEIQPSRQPEQWIVNKQLIAWSEELKLPLLATSDVHMVSKEERHIHEALTNIGKGGNKEKSEDDQDISVYESAYFMHPQEMLDNGIPAIAIQNAYDLSHRCQVDFLEQTDTKFPAYEVPIGHNFDSYLAKLAREGLFSIFMNKDYIKDYSGYQQRLEYELSIIAKKGLSAYFVIVWDYVNWARAQGIFVGPGRGSGAGALTLYALGITNVNPLKYDLLFERMLNPERDSLPDIDEDFDFLRRSEVIEYITQKYGSDHVAQIGTYTTLSSKIVLKDVGRILGIDHTYINDLNKELPSHNGKVMDLADAVEEIPSFQKASELYPELFELALDLQSMPRGAGVHPCFDEDTLITTDEGLKRIVDVKVGDKVLTHERRFMPVMETMVNRSDDIYHAHTSSNHPVRVTGNHPFLVKEMTYKRLRKYKDGVDTKFKTFSEPKWKSVSDMAVGVDYIGVPTNNESVVPNYSEFNLPFGKEEFWWIVGRYIGNGWTERYDRTTPAGYPHVEKRVIICCTKNHDDEKDLIVSYLEALGFDYRCEKARTTYKIFIKQEGLFDYLQFYGKYAHGKSIYQDVFDLPVPLGQHFLEGYISADGSYLEREDKRCIRTVSKELAIGVMQLVNKFFQRPTGLQFSQPKTEIIEGRTVNSKKKYTISFTQTQRKLSRSFYEDGYIWTRLEKLIKEEDSRPMYNLTVLDDSSYVANGMAVHNCGVEVSPVPLSSNLPLMRSREGTAVTQYEGPVLENIGYVKFDILGLKNLSVLRIACELIKARHSIDLDINNLEPDDADVFEMIRKGNTMGIFQLESPGMTQVFTGLNHVDFNSLMAGVALYRPGPMAFIPQYQARANGIEPVRYVTPEYEEFTKDTFGILVYQEQCMLLVQRMAGYSPGEADTFRKAIGKKKESVMRPALEELRRRLAEHNHKQEVIDEIIKQIEPFVGYGFNKSHSVAYSLIAYFTAYLKYHYREEFFTALLTVFESQDTKVSNYVQDARAQGISILKPSVNRSDSEFKIEAEGVIRYGLGSIKGLGEKAINEIASLRPFTDLADFIGRTTKSNVNKRSLQALVFSGALDELAGTVTNRMEILQILYGIRGDKDDLSTEVDEFNKRKMLEKEKELLKVYISGHPLEDIARPIPWEEIEDGERVVGHCMLSSIRRIVTKKGDPMAFIQLEFMEQEVEAVCFPRLYQSNYTYGKDVQPVVLGPSLKENMILKVTGHYEESSDGRRSFLLDDIVVPIRINKDKVDEIRSLAEPAVTVPEELVRLPIYQAPLPGF